MGTGVKLEPLSSCVPLGLGLPSSTTVHDYERKPPWYTSPLNAHLLPTGAAKRFFLPALPSSLSLDTQSSSYGSPSPSRVTTTRLLHSAYTDTSDSGSRRGSFERQYPPFSQGLKGGYEEEPAVYGGHPLEYRLDIDMDTLELDRIDPDHHRVFPLEAGYALSSSHQARGGIPRLWGPHERTHEVKGMRTNGRPRAVSDVLTLERRGGGGAWDGVGERAHRPGPGSGLGISLNMGLTRGLNVGAGARSMSGGSTGSTDDSA
ncbi:hypothetical protein B0H13DRAFT_2298335 [Mycena leptocephala]|nr:hypothetical protein B0H13DRAFT_2298335 [Mycena leptocephala]